MSKQMEQLEENEIIATTKRNVNPFMVASNQSYGLSLSELKKNHELNMQKKKSIISNSNNNVKQDQKEDLSFIYRKESDRIGSGIKLSDSKLAKVLGEQESLSLKSNQRRLSSSSNNNNDCCEGKSNKATTTSKEQIQTIIQSYNHNPKKEHPLYSTSANSFGSKKISMATYPAKCYSRSQSFSASFNRIKFRDQGLNTSLTRSNVHKHLDPQFV